MMAQPVKLCQFMIIKSGCSRNRYLIHHRALKNLRKRVGYGWRFSDWKQHWRIRRMALQCL